MTPDFKLIGNRLYDLVSGPRGASWAPAPVPARTPVPPRGGRLQAWGADTFIRGGSAPAAGRGGEPRGGGALSGVFQNGSTGSAVADLQGQLQAAGFDPRGIDGDFGPNTEAAVRAFQTAKGLTVDGVVGPETEAALATPAAPAPADAPANTNTSGQMLQNGATGPAVQALQQALTQAGFDTQGIDGDFGPNTEAAVRAFQAAKGLEVDGVVGPASANALGVSLPAVAAPSAASSGFGNAAVAAGRQLQANGYHYTTNLTSQYDPVRFQVGCCADFAVDTWAKAGSDLYGQVSNPHYCPTLVDYFKQGGGGHGWVPYGGAAQPGDMVFFNWNGNRSGEADHVAIVTEVDGQGQPTQIIESYDFGLPVRERQVGSSAGCIVGYGRA